MNLGWQSRRFLPDDVEHAAMDESHSDDAWTE